MFYTYYQNNSGGEFLDDKEVGKYVIIEADTANEANEKAQKCGIYFNGYEENIDCDCCGDRWYKAYDRVRGGTSYPTPTINGYTLEEYRDKLDIYSKEIVNIHIYYKDNKHEIFSFNAKEAVSENEERKRKNADKLWGVNINLTWDLSKTKPIRFFKSEIDKNKYWDKTRNNSISGIGMNILGKPGEHPTYVSFGSKSKNEVQDFIDGMIETLNEAKREIAKINVSHRIDPKSLGRNKMIEMLNSLGNNNV